MYPIHHATADHIFSKRILLNNIEKGSVLGNPESLILKIFSRRRQPWWCLLNQYSQLSTTQKHIGDANICWSCSTVYHSRITFKSWVAAKLVPSPLSSLFYNFDDALTKSCTTNISKIKVVQRCSGYKIESQPLDFNVLFCEFVPFMFIYHHIISLKKHDGDGITVF